MKTESLTRSIEIKNRAGQVIGQKEVVTYEGLLAKAHEEGLKAIRTTLVQAPLDQNNLTAIVKAEVATEKGSFEGIGDANPENVGSFIVPHLIRMAETRAKARALRDAVNIGVISFEELDGEALASEASDPGLGAKPPVSRTRRNVGNMTDSAKPGRKGANGGGQDPMTEAQRRYLFRILAGQGLSTEAAHEQLRDLFGVEDLTLVSKFDAGHMIDRLLQESGEGKPNGGLQPQR